MTFPLMPVMMPSSKVPTVEFKASSSGNLGGTFTIGSPSSEDRFVVFVTSNQVGNVDLTSCTMNGVAASVASSRNASFACAPIPTGSTVNIVTNYASGGGTSTEYAGFVYVVYGLESPVWRYAGLSISGTLASLTVPVPESGLIFSPVQISNDKSSVAFSSGMTLDVNRLNGTSSRMAAAHHNAFPATSTYTLTCRVSDGAASMGAGVLR